jgi:PAB-dependent poly(A)-specific ribonuclease subunit 3
MHTKEPSTEWQGQDFQEFVPQTFDGQMVRSQHRYVNRSLR